jgi:large subunit ribosomal protein L7/L12
MIRWCGIRHAGGRAPLHSFARVPPQRRNYSASRETTKTGITNPSYPRCCSLEAVLRFGPLGSATTRTNRILRPQFRLLHSTRRLNDAAAAATESVPPLPPILWTTHRLNAQQIAKVDAIFHKILWLDLFETSMLNDLVNERLGLTMTPKQRHQLSQFMEARAAGTSLSSSSTSASEPPEEAKPVLVDLKLTGFDAAAKIKVIKVVRSILNLGLKEAKEMVEGAPVILQKGMKPELAEELKTQLEAAGAKVEVQ